MIMYIRLPLKRQNRRHIFFPEAGDGECRAQLTWGKHGSPRTTASQISICRLSFLKIAFSLLGPLADCFGPRTTALRGRRQIRDLPTLMWGHLLLFVTAG